jgi:hypothetical protein
VTARTERQPTAPIGGVAGEGQNGMPKEGHGMTGCAEAIVRAGAG